MFTRAPAASSHPAVRTLPIAVLVVALAVTAIAGWATRQRVVEARRQRFESLTMEARTAIERHVASYAETLYGLRSLFAVGGDISRATFHDYLAQNDIVHRFPGAKVVSFDRAVPASDRLAYEERVRRDTSLNGVGYPDFSVHPPESTPELFVAEYLEPFAGNEVVLGTNIFADPIRRSAIEQARDSGDLVATAPVELFHGKGRGFALYLAVYDARSTPLTAPARRRHFRGAVAAVFESKVMFGEVLGSTGRLELDIYDVGLSVDPPSPAPDRASLIFDADEAGRPLRPYPGGTLHGSRDLNVGSRRWRIYAAAGRDFNVSAERFLPWVVVGFGSTLSLALAALVGAFGRSRRLALAYADEMTVNLRQRETELQDTNRLLSAAVERLQESDRARTAFLSVISHELQTPLAAISGLTRLLIGRVSADEETADVVRRIARNAHTLSVVIDQLVDFTRTELEAIPLALRPVDLGQLVEQALDQLETFLTDRVLELDLQPGVIVQADPDAVTRILNNLLSNAVKFSPRGSAIGVRVTDGDGVGELRVEDRGSGFPEADHPRVFEPFFRGSEALAVGRPGTGIGLAVVKDLVERMGGSVTASNREDGGACLSVALPVTPPG